jgi:hypothetical protein
VTTKIALVGDLSFGDPTRLARVLDAALIGADVVLQAGDINPGYPQVKSRWLTSGHKLFPVKGNHDTGGLYEQIGCPAVWQHQTADGLVTINGLDNSAGTLTPDSKALYDQPKSTPYEFTLAHMPPVDMVLPDGSTNGHNMAEAGGGDDAAWLAGQLRDRADAYLCGHYHGWTLQQAPFGPLIVDGRGGAAPDLAYTLITVTEQGWVLHSVGV